MNSIQALNTSRYVCLYKRIVNCKDKTEFEIFKKLDFNGSLRVTESAICLLELFFGLFVFVSSLLS